MKNNNVKEIIKKAALKKVDELKERGVFSEKENSENIGGLLKSFFNDININISYEPYTGILDTAVGSSPEFTFSPKDQYIKFFISVTGFNNEKYNPNKTCSKEVKVSFVKYAEEIIEKIIYEQYMPACLIRPGSACQDMILDSSWSDFVINRLSKARQDLINRSKKNTMKSIYRFDSVASLDLLDILPKPSQDSFHIPVEKFKSDVEALKNYQLVNKELKELKGLENEVKNGDITKSESYKEKLLQFEKNFSLLYNEVEILKLDKDIEVHKKFKNDISADLDRLNGLKKQITDNMIQFIDEVQKNGYVNYINKIDDIYQIKDSVLKSYNEKLEKIKNERDVEIIKLNRVESEIEIENMKKEIDTMKKKIETIKREIDIIKKTIGEIKTLQSILNSYKQKLINMDSKDKTSYFENIKKIFNNIEMTKLNMYFTKNT